ncbi:MAG: hypothetical protein EXQ87_13535 [Alphaproteobacteria bacterium]|nr:hypothetical protein [Alphaproteobacteria bacterium]
MEIVVWRMQQPVPPSTHRYEYRMVYIVNGKRVLGYDNERGKGDHKHIGGREEPVDFTRVNRLLAQFAADVKAMRRRA